MFRYKFILTAVILTAVTFISFVNSGNADFEIVESPSNSNTYIYGGWTYDVFTVETSEPHFTVSWFVDGVPVYSSGDGTLTKSVYCPTDTLAGSLRGIRYEIEIEAWSADGLIKDTASFYLTVYEPATDWRQEPDTSVYCYSEISRHYYRPSSQLIYADYYAYAYNPLPEGEVGRLVNRQHQLEYYLQVFGTGVHDFDKKPYPIEELPPQGYAGFESYTLVVNITRGAETHDYESDATITHDIRGGAPLRRIAFGTTQTFEKK